MAEYTPAPYVIWPPEDADDDELEAWAINKMRLAMQGGYERLARIRELEAEIWRLQSEILRNGGERANAVGHFEHAMSVLDEIDERRRARTV
jgi:hypothetical protein